MLTRKALFFKVCMDISYPKKTSGILTYFSLILRIKSHHGYKKALKDPMSIEARTHNPKSRVMSLI
ncbi:hypothetical protein E5E84_04000 [Helicobacter pylori]|nr:hypothetical protein E5E84_04000 [Helicobacter pylori]